MQSLWCIATCTHTYSGNICPQAYLQKKRSTTKYSVDVNKFIKIINVWHHTLMRAIVVSMSKTPHGPVVYNEVGYDTPNRCIVYVQVFCVIFHRLSRSIYLLCSLVVRFSTMLSNVFTMHWQMIESVPPYELFFLEKVARMKRLLSLKAAVDTIQLALGSDLTLKPCHQKSHSLANCRTKAPVDSRHQFAFAAQSKPRILLPSERNPWASHYMEMLCPPFSKDSR